MVPRISVADDGNNVDGSNDEVTGIGCVSERTTLAALRFPR